MFGYNSPYFGSYKNDHKDLYDFINSLTNKISTTDYSNLIDNVLQKNKSYTMKYRDDKLAITFPLPGYNKDQIEIVREGDKLIVSTQKYDNQCYTIDGLPEFIKWDEFKDLIDFTPIEASTIIELPNGFENSKYSIHFLNGVLYILLVAKEVKKTQTMKIL